MPINALKVAWHWSFFNFGVEFSEAVETYAKNAFMLVTLRTVGGRERRKLYGIGVQHISQVKPIYSK